MSMPQSSQASDSMQEDGQKGTELLQPMLLNQHFWVSIWVIFLTYLETLL